MFRVEKPEYVNKTFRMPLALVQDLERIAPKTSGTRIKPAAASILIAMRMALPATPIYSAVSPACPFHPSHLGENWRAMSAMRSLSARK